MSMHIKRGVSVQTHMYDIITAHTMYNDRINITMTKIISVETDCKLKGIDIETACIVRFNYRVITDSVYDRIEDTISSDVVTINSDFDFKLIVCNAEMATYLELTFGDYIAYIYTYKEWHDHRIQYE